MIGKEYNAYSRGGKCLHDSIVVSIPACHAGDRGSIPRRGVLFLNLKFRRACYLKRIKKGLEL